MSSLPQPTTEIVVVDQRGRPVGTTDKLSAHQAPGIPHLAFSVLLFDGHGRLLVQRRAASKYHFAGLWSNSCCGHPPPGEVVTRAAERRIRDELGIAAAGLNVVGAFWYRAIDTASGLVEYEYDLVLRGRSPSKLRPNPAEVSEVDWLDIRAARHMCVASPELVTPWFANVLETGTRRPYGT